MTTESFDFYEQFTVNDNNISLNFLNKYFSLGLWYQLERRTRSYAEKYGSIHVISGIIFDEDNNGKVDGDKVEKTLVNFVIQ